jgi:hypothetical protein
MMLAAQKAASRSVVSLLAMLLVGCAQLQNSVAGTAVTLASAASSTANLKRVAVGECCSLVVPASAEAASSGVTIDSLAFAHYKVGASEVFADLRSLVGIAADAGALNTERDVEQAGVAGYQNRLQYTFRSGARIDTLSVTVICPTLRCELAEQVFSSVEVNGKAVLRRSVSGM